MLKSKSQFKETKDQSHLNLEKKQILLSRLRTKAKIRIRTSSQSSLTISKTCAMCRSQRLTKANLTTPSLTIAKYKASYPKMCHQNNCLTNTTGSYLLSMKRRKIMEKILKTKRSASLAMMSSILTAAGCCRLMIVRRLS